MSFWEDQKVSKQYANSRPTLPPYAVSEMKKFFAETHTSDEEITILDIGCGPGVITRILAEEFPNATVTGIDISDTQTHEAKKRFADVPKLSFKTHNCDDGIPFDDQSLDLVISTTAIHWLDWGKLCVELKRVMRPNGLFVITSMADINMFIEGVDQNTQNRVNQATLKVMQTLLDEGYSDRRITIPRSDYRHCLMPFPKQLNLLSSDKRMHVQQKSTIKGYFNLLSTIQGVINYHTKNPEGTLFTNLRNFITANVPMKGIQDSVSDHPVTMNYPFVMRMAMNV